MNLNLFSLSEILLTCLSVFIFVLYSCFYFFGIREKTSIPFIILCFNVAAMCVCRSVLYCSADPFNLFMWEKIYHFFLSAFGVAFLWFVSVFSEINFRRILLIVSFCFIALVLFDLLIGNDTTLSMDNIHTRNFSIPGIISIKYHEIPHGPVIFIQKISVLFIFSFIFLFFVKTGINDVRRRIIAFSCVVLLIGHLNDISVAAYLIPSIYLADFCSVIFLAGLFYKKIQIFTFSYHEFDNVKLHLQTRLDDTNKKLEQAEDDVESAIIEMGSMIDSLVETNSRLEDADRIMKKDLDMASHIQSSVFVNRSLKCKDWDISFLFKPMAGVSGDLFDFYLENNKLSGASIFDVSGHGIAAGLISMIARTIVFRDFKRMKEEKINRVLERINSKVIREFKNVDNYLTGLMFRIDDDKISYVNAGHPDLIQLKKNRRVRIIGAGRPFKGPFLGIDIMEQKYEIVDFKVEEGDVLLYFTDCFFESINPEGEEYGMDNIINSLVQTPDHYSVQEMLDSIVEKFYTYTGTKKLKDDLTVVLIKKISSDGNN